MDISFTPAFHNHLTHKLLERLEDYLDALSSGCASDFADYRYRCGQIFSLREAIAVAEETRKQILEN